MKIEKKKKRESSNSILGPFKNNGSQVLFQCCEVAGQGDHWKSSQPNLATSQSPKLVCRNATGDKLKVNI